MKSLKIMVMCVMAIGIANAAVDDCSSYPDGGSGWLSDWQSDYSSVASDGSVITATQSSTDDDYLRRREDRDMASATGIISIQADITLSDLSNFDTSNDYVFLTQALRQHGGTSSDSTFIIRGHGADSGGAVANKWAWYDGNADNGSFDTNLLVDSGMLMEAGVTYSFTINVDVDNMSYDVTIDNGTASVSGTNLGWRSSLDHTENWFIAGSKQDLSSDGLSYSIDNISIVPEPATMLLLGLGGLVIRRRFR